MTAGNPYELAMDIIDGRTEGNAGQVRDLLRMAVECGIDDAIQQIMELYFDDVPGFDVDFIKQMLERGMDKGLASAFAFAINPDSENEEIFVRLRDAEARTGDLMLTALLSTCYGDGFGTEKDYDKAYELAVKAHEGGNIKADPMLAYLLLNGYGCEQDVPRALDMLNDLALDGDTSSMMELAWTYDDGLLVEQDKRKAMEFAELAAATDPSRESMVFIASHYLPDDVQSDIDAVAALETFADLGDTEALFFLYSLYSAEDYPSRDLAKAAGYLRRGAELGDLECIRELAIRIAADEIPEAYEDEFMDLVRDGAEMGEQFFIDALESAEGRDVPTDDEE